MSVRSKTTWVMYRFVNTFKPELPEIYSFVVNTSNLLLMQRKSWYLLQSKHALVWRLPTFWWFFCAKMLVFSSEKDGNKKKMGRQWYGGWESVEGERLAFPCVLVWFCNTDTRWDSKPKWCQYFDDSLHNLFLALKVFLLGFTPHSLSGIRLLCCNITTLNTLCLRQGKWRHLTLTRTCMGGEKVNFPAHRSLPPFPQCNADSNFC